MTQTVTVTRRVRCPLNESTAFVTDPRRLFPEVSTFTRCEFIKSRDDGELWDVFMESGTIQLGGRVLITPPKGSLLKWRSVLDNVLFPMEILRRTDTAG